jgi:hypothetical protein
MKKLHFSCRGIFFVIYLPIKITEDMETVFRLVKIKDRLPDFGERVLFLDDRLQVVRRGRSLGLTVLNVAYGNF